MFEVQVTRGGKLIDSGEAEDAESAVACAICLIDDDQRHYANAFPGRLYGARFYVDGHLSFVAGYSDLFLVAA